MTDGVSIIWTADRAVSAYEKRLIATAAGAADAQVVEVPMSALARELPPSSFQGPVVVVVGSRKDAATARGLGADEVVRVLRSVGLRKATIGSAIERARAHARARGGATKAREVTVREASSDAFLISVLERRLGSPLDAATTKCQGLANELKGAVAAADRLMRRVQRGAEREGLKRWRGDVKDYALATLKAEALAVELEEQVGRTNGVVQALDNLSLDEDSSETDASAFLQHFAEFLGDGLPRSATVRVDAPHPCVVAVPRQTLVGMLSAAIESALYNMLEAGSVGRISLRARVTDPRTVVVEVEDDGARAQGTVDDPPFSDSRAEQLRQLRRRARRAGGEMTLNSESTGNILCLYLPLALPTTADPPMGDVSRGRRRRRQRVGPPARGTLTDSTNGGPSEPRNQ
jgi:hypothetical protein